MTCKEIHEQITAYVDNRVDEQEYRSKVQQHITYCPDCRAAYELELMTKLAVQERAKRSTASDALRRSIESGVDAMSDDRRAAIAAPEVRTVSAADRFWSFFTAPIGVAVAVLLVIVGAWAIVRPSGPSTAEIVDTPGPVAGSEGARKVVAENFFNKSLQNFEAIVAGQLSPQFSTSDSRELSEFFKEKGVGYAVAYPRVSAPLAGGVVSNHGDLHFAHVIYTKGDQVYYIFEVPQALLRKGDAVYVTKDVMDRLDHGEKIWQEPGGSQRLVMFKKGDVVCAMVSNAPRAAMESAAS